MNTSTYQRSYVGELFVGGDKDRLHKELVAALCIWRGVFLHGLEKDWVDTLADGGHCRGRRVRNDIL